MTEISIKEQNAEALARVAKEQKKIEKKKQVLAFAETLGLSGKRAKALRKLGGDYFKMDSDGLKFRAAGDRLVSPDNSECVAFFKKKFDFLLGDDSQGGDPQIDPRLIAHANSADPKIAAIAKKALLAAQGSGGKDVVVAADTPHKNNPWKDLRGRDGKISAEKMARCENFIKLAGTKAAASMARSAGVRLDGTSLDPKYL